MNATTFNPQSNHIGSGPAAASQRNKTNPFLAAATPLLTLMTQFKHTETQPDVPKMREQVVNEVKLFEQKLKRLGYNSRVLNAARYCLCVTLDEAALKSTWGTQSVWVQQTLSSIFLGVVDGGERFYSILKMVANQPQQNIDFLEFLYVLLSLGFEGKFFGKDRMVREEIRNQAYERIRHCRGKVEKALSRHWKDVKPLQQNRKKRATLKRMSLLGAVIVLAMIGVFNIIAHKNASKVLVELNKVAQASVSEVYPRILKQAAVLNANEGENQ